MYIGIDIGGTKIAAGLADNKGKLIKKLSVKTTNVIAQVAVLLTELTKEINKKQIKAVGIGIPGQVDKTGRVFNMPNIPSLLGINLIRELKKKHNFEYFIENDANAAALAELKFGAGKDLNNFIYVTISTGIGGGIVLDKKLYKGANYTAGEIGHMIILPDGPQCGCGNKGCWEVLGSGTALTAMARAKIIDGAKTKITELVNNNLKQINGEIIFKAAKQKDRIAVELVAVNGYYNAVGITNLVNIFDPEAIIVGGGLSFNGKLFFDSLKENLKLFKLLNSKNKIKILKAGCKKDSGLLGALAVALTPSPSPEGRG